MDFREVMVAALDKVVASGHIEGVVEKAIETTIKQVIESELRQYSDFGKTVTDAVKKSLEIHGGIDLPAYNQIILKIIKLQVEKHTRATVEKQVAENVAKLLQPAPESINLSDLVEAFIEYLKQGDNGLCACHGDSAEAYIDVDRTDRGFVWVAMHHDHDFKTAYASSSVSERHQKRFRSDIQLGVSDGKIFDLRFGSDNVEKELFAGPFYDFQRKVFQMRAAGTKIIFDCEPDELSTYYTVGEVAD